jgi:hypothetical protein
VGTMTEIICPLWPLPLGAVKDGATGTKPPEPPG